jgi:Zeta toxin
MSQTLVPGFQDQDSPPDGVREGTANGWIAPRANRRPRAVLVAGQYDNAKRKIYIRLRRRLRERGRHAIIDPDMRLQRLEVESESEPTEAQREAILNRSEERLARAIDESRDLIIGARFHDPEAAIELLQGLRTRGYRVFILAIVPPSDSRSACGIRPTEDDRLVVVETLRAIAAEAAAERIDLIDHHGRCLASTIRQHAFETREIETLFGVAAEFSAASLCTTDHGVGSLAKVVLAPASAVNTDDERIARCRVLQEKLRAWAASSV